MRPSIPHLVRAALLVGAAAVAISSCGGSNDEKSASTGGGGGIVSVATVDGTKVLADSAGRTLYSADVERGGRIRCVDACLSFWKPVAASGAQAKTAAAELGSKFDVVKRPDGSRQLARDGLPLYTFAEEDAGQLKGDGFVDDFQGTHFEWQAARTGGGSQSSGSDTQNDNGGGGYGY